MGSLFFLSLSLVFFYLCFVCCHLPHHTWKENKGRFFWIFFQCGVRFLSDQSIDWYTWVFWFGVGGGKGGSNWANRLAKLTWLKIIRKYFKPVDGVVTSATGDPGFKSTYRQFFKYGTFIYCHQTVEMTKLQNSKTTNSKNYDRNLGKFLVTTIIDDFKIGMMWCLSTKDLNNYIFKIVLWSLPWVFSLIGILLVTQMHWGFRYPLPP